MTDRSPLPDPLAACRSPLASPTPEAILSLKICDIAVGSAAFLVESCRQLADVLVVAWRKHGGRPQVPPDETEELLAMRLVAQRCLYGVDRNSMAVDLAKLSLWLATLAKDHPFTFLDHAIRCGDSLVGLTRRQIETFTWKTEATQEQLWEQEVRKRTAAALRERQNLLGLGDDHGTPQLKRENLEKADELLDLVRFIGDAAIAAFFSADRDKAREAKRAELAERIGEYLSTRDLRLKPEAEVAALRGERTGASGAEEPAGAHVDSPMTSDCFPLPARSSPLAARPVLPFHWEIEYPEVFDRENPGFDGIVGNPPFAGKNTLSSGNREGYIDWLKSLHDESHGNADLVAHFFRRAFNAIRNGGTFGLIATNTIGQGDTRATGLRCICTRGGVIYATRKRAKWPGQAAVVVSVVWVTRGNHPSPFDLDGRSVPVITAYLFHAGGHENPMALRANESKGFIGSYVLGMGFTFDDTDKSGVANPLSLMHELIAKDPRNAERIFPYIGGEEVNDSPTHAHHRYVINFAEMTENEGRRWPELMKIVEAKVRPEREKLGNDGDAKRRKKNWWLWGRYTPGLFAAISESRQMLAVSLVTQHLGFGFLPTTHVPSKNTCVFAFESYGPFSVIQSSVHEVWARFFSSTLEDRLNYSPSDCFETFPFPAGFGTNAALEAAGRNYHDFRAALMEDLWLGLTEIYNLFHAPDEEGLARLETLYRKRAANSEWRSAEKVPEDRSPLTTYRSPPAALGGVRRLRELHAAMDAAVLTAYGWEDLIPKCTCEFLLDYEDEEDEAEEGKTRKRKKPWRYRWPDDVRDEVLARLLKLNAERAEEERIAGSAASAPAQRKAKRATKSSAVAPSQPELLPDQQRDLFA